MNDLREMGIATVPEPQSAAAPTSRIELPEIDNAKSLLADDKVTLPPEVIEGVLHQGLKGVLGGNSKARKTWILLDAAISVATGTKFWMWNTRQGRVLYINFEIPRAFIRTRIQAICKHKMIAEIGGLDVWNLRGYGAALGNLLPSLLSRIEDGKYSLIVIDPIYKGLGGRDENSAGDISELCNELEQLAMRTGAAVVYAAHFSKGNQASKEAIDRISGSGVWTRDADTIITLTKHETEGAYSVDLILRNLPEQAAFVVEWKFPGMCLAPHLSPDDLKKAKGGRRKAHNPEQLCSAIAKSTAKNPVSISKWSELAGIKRQTLSDYLPELRKKGWITTVGEGSSARQHLTQKGKQAVKLWEKTK